MNRPIPFFARLLLVTAFASCQVSRASSATPATSSQEGVSLAIVARGDTYVVGEPIILALSVRNDSEFNWSIGVSSPYRIDFGAQEIGGPSLRRDHTLDYHGGMVRVS